MPEARSAALPLRVLGVDPGLAVTGYAIVDERGQGGTLVTSGTVKSTTKMPRADRLGRIFDATRALIAEYQPHEVAIEQQFVAESVRSAMVVGEARAAAMVAASIALRSASRVLRPACSRAPPTLT